MNRTRNNLFANYIGTIVQITGPIVSLPFYLSLLGPTQFGLLSFIATIQGTLAMLDAGFAQVSAREFAVLTNRATPDYSSVAYYLHRFERIFWALSITAALATACISGVLVEHWLLTSTASEKSLSHDAIIGAALIFAVQFPSSLYRSYLVGSQQQVKLNIISSTAVLVRHGGGIIILWLHPTFHTYLFWQVLSYGMETLVRKLVSWRSVGNFPIETLEYKQRFSNIFKDSLGMFVAVLLGTITTQMDKIVLSGTLPLEQFGYYSIATTVSMGVSMAIQPIVQAVSPLMMQSANNKEALRRSSIKLAKLISVVVIIFTIGYIALGYSILTIWLRNVQAINYIYPILSILLVGSALNAFYHVGYYNWMARGKTRNILMVNIISFLMAISITPILIKMEGVMGATFGFVAMNLLGLILSIGWARKPTDLKWK